MITANQSVNGNISSNARLLLGALVRNGMFIIGVPGEYRLISTLGDVNTQGAGSRIIDQTAVNELLERGLLGCMVCFRHVYEPTPKGCLEIGG